MKVRDIVWFRTDKELLSNQNVLNMDKVWWHQWHRWNKYSFLDTFRYEVSTREYFEKDYLKWKDKNEG